MYEDDNFKDYLLMKNTIVDITDLPTYIKGLTVKMTDYYVIILNSKYDLIHQRKTLAHELAHVELGHLELSDIASKFPELEKEVYQLLQV